MCSRFTEIFHAHQPWELCNSEPSSPSVLTSTNEFSFFTSSSDTLNTLSDLNVSSNKSNTYSYLTQQKFPLDSTLSENDSPSSNSKNRFKSKLKLFLSTIHRNNK